MKDSNFPFQTHWITRTCAAIIAVMISTLWWRHQMETFSALLAICAGNWPVPGEFPAQRPVTRSFDVFFGLRPNKRLSKQWWGWGFQTPSHPLWHHCNAFGAGCIRAKAGVGELTVIIQVIHLQGMSCTSYVDIYSTSLLTQNICGPRR